MKASLLLTLATALPMAIFGGSIDLGTGTTGENTVSFNGNYDTLTLGSQNCVTVDVPLPFCALQGSLNDLAGTNWWFYQPDTTTSLWTYTYNGTTGTVSTTETNANDFEVVFQDSYGDEVEGTYNLTGLQSDGNNGVYIYGTVNLNYLTEGINEGASVYFDDELGLPIISGAINVNYNLTLDVGNCTAGQKSTDVCVPPSVDPTGTLIDGSLSSGAPEPASFILFGTGLACVGLVRRVRKNR